MQVADPSAAIGCIRRRTSGRVVSRRDWEESINNALLAELATKLTRGLSKTKSVNLARFVSSSGSAGENNAVLKWRSSDCEVISVLG